MTLNLEPLENALFTLEQAIELYREHEENEVLAIALRDSIVQRFEYTYELAWKMMKRWISGNVSPEAAEEVYSRKELFRLAAKNGLIEDPVRWFTYHEARNVSAHTYDEANAEKAFEAAIEMVEDVQFLLQKLEKRND